MARDQVSKIFPANIIVIVPLLVILAIIVVVPLLVILVIIVVVALSLSSSSSSSFSTLWLQSRHIFIIIVPVTIIKGGLHKLFS